MAKGGNDILKNFKKGKLDTFYQVYYRRYVLFAIKMLGANQDILAEDCVQNAIYAAWEHRDLFDTMAALQGYLYTAIRNDAVSVHRKTVASKRYAEHLEEGITFRNAVIDQEIQALLFEAINQLPEKMRVIFEMSFMEGLKSAEIAKRLDITDSAVRKSKSKALKILREKLRPELYFFLFTGII